MRALTFASLMMLTAMFAAAESSRMVERVEQFLLDSIRAGDIDAWIILTREGNLDPLSEDFGFHLGTGALVFWDRGADRIERWALLTC